MLTFDKPNLSYADFHHEITRDSDGQQSQLLERPTLKEDELVKHMSNLPSYLEKGKDVQEKALNVGVLDWKLLEKWRYNQKQTGQSQTHNGVSPSSSSSTSVFSTDGSSSRSTVGQSYSPGQQRTHPRFVKVSVEEGKGKFQDQDSVFSMHNPLYRQQKAGGTLPLSKRNESDSKISTGRNPIVEKHEVFAPWKGKTKMEACGPTKQTPKPYETKVEDVLTMPSEPTYAYRVDGKLSLEIEKKFCGRNSFERSSLPHKVVNEHLDPKNIKNPSNASLISHRCTNNKMFDGPSKLPFPSRVLSSPSRSRNMVEKKPFVGVTNKPKDDVDVRRISCSVPRARNPSPIRRLGSAMGKMIRDRSPVRRSSSKDCLTKSNSDGPSVPCSMDTSRDSNRGRSSPLRRLLDPILKPRGSNNPEPSKKQPSSRPSSDMSHLLRGGCSLSLQALLQVSFKNGFPLFTFAIDNEIDILAATVRKLFVPGKGHHYWTYTFFNVHEVKRKSGIWLNHGGNRPNNHGYVPNVVAQMKVTDTLKHEDTNDHFTREFNLFAVDVGHGDQCNTDFHPTNELAAIVAKIPLIYSEDCEKNGQLSYSWLDLSGFRSNDEAHSSDDLHVGTSVILPGGVHTVPSKGEMSTLAQRWRSGGCCDCGGWDLGCQLQVYRNQRECERGMNSSPNCSSENKSRLFSLVGQDKQPILTLSPFKDRIYSIEFNSSLSLLQAFAICISHLDYKRPPELSEPIHIAQKINQELSKHSYPPHSPFGRV